MPLYREQLKEMIITRVDKSGPGRDTPLEGLKVVVNAGNGMGGFVAELLQEVRRGWGTALDGGWTLALADAADG